MVRLAKASVLVAAKLSARRWLKQSDRANVKKIEDSNASDESNGVREAVRLSRSQQHTEREQKYEEDSSGSAVELPVQL